MLMNDNRPMIDRFGEESYLKKVLNSRPSDGQFAFYNNPKYSNMVRCTETEEGAVSGFAEDITSIEGIINRNHRPEMI